MRELNNANAAATFTLSMRLYRGYLLSARYIEETLVQTITEAHSLEQLELLANASLMLLFLTTNIDFYVLFYIINATFYKY